MLLKETRPLHVGRGRKVKAEHKSQVALRLGRRVGDGQAVAQRADENVAVLDLEGGGGGG